MRRFVFLIGILLLSLTVNAQKTLTVTALGIDKVYDRSTLANVTLSIAGLDPGVDVIPHYTIANFDTWDVGFDKPILVEGIYLTGADAGDYSYNNNTAITTACITPRPIIGGFSAADKYYDITTDATIIDRYLLDVLPGDEDGVEIYGGTANFVDPNVGNNKPVNQNGIALRGYRAFNYYLDNVGKATANILPLQVIARFEAEDKIYDKTITAEISRRWLEGLFLQDTASIKLIGGNAVFDNWNAGEDKFVYGDKTFSITGNELGNYEVIIIYTTTATIFPRPVDIYSVQDIKVYDQTTDSDETPYAYPDLAAGDFGTYWQVYDTRIVGTGKTMYPYGEIQDGNNGDNYIITWVLNYEGIITPLRLIPNFLVQDKVYDGTTDAIMADRWADGVLKGDNVYLVGGDASFDDPWVGNNKPVTGTGLSLIGSDAKSYIANSVATTKAHIVPLLVSSKVTSDRSVYHNQDDLVTLTLVINNGGPLVNGGPWAGMFTVFRLDGFILRDAANNDEIELQIDPATNDLIGTITVPLSSMAVDGIMEPGTKVIHADLYDEDRNYVVSPNPAISQFVYASDQEIIAYPNPSSGSFKVAYSPKDQGLLKLSLVDMFGKVLLEKEYSASYTHISDFISLPSHASGIYYIRIKDGPDVYYKKVVFW